MTSTSRPTRSDLKAPLWKNLDPQPELHSSEDASRRQLRQWMQDCRQQTIDLFAELDETTFRHHTHPDFSPIGWHLGHIGYTESLWLLEHLAKQPCPFPQYRRLYAADGLPKSERVHLPTLPETLAYLNAIRQPVLDYLDIAPIAEQQVIWRFLLQHESQHCETVTLLLELQKLARSPSPLPPLSPSPPPVPEMLPLPAGPFTCGSQAISTLDNERPAHSRYLDAYWIDRYPVTCQQYRVFMEAGGYYDHRWWSEAGWHWLQASGITQPLYWRQESGWDHHPVCGVSWYEADAYARFVGKRLPTEFEWEKAARWNPQTQESQTFPWGEAEPDRQHGNHSRAIGQTTPVNAYPAGDSPCGCSDMLGNVWEWTSSWFAGYEGFEPFPYRGYSQAYFDNQHRVLRGGSWATRQWAMRGSFRNWYHPHVREILAGFRCAANETSSSTLKPPSS